MDTPDTVQFRTRFKAFVGDDSFRKFIAQIHRTKYRKTGLRYWQQELWSEFVAKYPEHSMSIEAIRSALAICELHELDLIPIVVPVFEGCLDYAPDYIADMVALFPHATLTKSGKDARSWALPL